MSDDSVWSCEKCGVDPKSAFGMHDYCVHCSKNLCPDCLKLPYRQRKDGGSHEVEEQ